MTIREVTQRITFFREKANLSARELSLKIGKHAGYINKLESQDFNLPTDVLLLIIDALGITPEKFFYMGELYNRESRLFLEKYNNLSDSNKQTITDLIDKLQ